MRARNIASVQALKLKSQRPQTTAYDSLKATVGDPAYLHEMEKSLHPFSRKMIEKAAQKLIKEDAIIQMGQGTRRLYASSREIHPDVRKMRTSHIRFLQHMPLDGAIYQADIRSHLYGASEYVSDLIEMDILIQIEKPRNIIALTQYGQALREGLGEGLCLKPIPGTSQSKNSFENNHKEQNMKEWTTEDINTLAAMKKEGREYEYIAKTIGRTTDAVGKKFRQMVEKHQDILKKHGIDIENALRKTSHTRQITDKTGEESSKKFRQKSRSRKNNGLKRWSEEERKAVIRLQNEGVSFDNIAVSLNRTKKSVKSMYEYLQKTRPDLFSEKENIETGASIPAKTEAAGTGYSENNAFLIELEKYTGEEFKPHDPNHVAAAFSLAAKNHGRDIQKIAKVMNVPEKWVAFAFNSLDYSGIWPKEEESNPVRNAEAYSQMTRALRKDVPYLHDMRRRGLA